MKFKKKFVALALSSLVLGGCFSDSDSIPANIDSYVLTTSNALVGVDSSNGRTGDSLAITGLQASENLFDIDYRNADGRMWALSTLGNLYTINLETGAATLQSTLKNSLDPMLNNFALNAAETYSIDFNPTVDRLRIIGTDDMSYATNVENGLTVTNGSLTLAGGPANGVVVDAAYTDTFSTTAGRGTTLFSIDAQNGALYTQNVMTGALTQVASLGVAGLQDIQGYDIDPETQQGLAVFQVNGDTALYRVSTSAAATLVNGLDLDGETAIGFTTVTTANPTVVGLSESEGFFTFRYRTPETITDRTAVTGLVDPMNEVIYGMDYSTNSGDATNRPQSLYVLTNSNLYQTNALAPSALTSPRALTGGTALDPAVDYSIDFNPTNGGLRVVGSDDSNRAITITATNAATIADNAVITPGTRDLISHAYVNSVPGTTTTRLLAVDAAAREFVQQAVPAATTTSLNAISFAVARDTAFDIRYPGDAVVLFASKAASGDRTTLYSATAISGGGINVGSAIGQIGGSTGPTDILDLAIGQ